MIVTPTPFCRDGLPESSDANGSADVRGLGLVRTRLLRQGVSMDEEHGFAWPLVSGSADVRLRWHTLGSVT